MCLLNYVLGCRIELMVLRGISFCACKIQVRSLLNSMQNKSSPKPAPSLLLLVAWRRRVVLAYTEHTMSYCQGYWVLCMHALCDCVSTSASSSCAKEQGCCASVQFAAYHVWKMIRANVQRYRGALSYPCIIGMGKVVWRNPVWKLEEQCTFIAPRKMPKKVLSKRGETQIKIIKTWVSECFSCMMKPVWTKHYFGIEEMLLILLTCWSVFNLYLATHYWRQVKVLNMHNLQNW